PPVNADDAQAALLAMLGDNPTKKAAANARDAQAVCAACHTKFDPLGFGLEHYDLTGAWRTIDQRGHPVDATGSLNGASFDGALQLSAVLKKDPRLSSCFSQMLAQYALGRFVGEGDRCALDSVTEAASGGGHGGPALIQALV